MSLATALEQSRETAQREVHGGLKWRTLRNCALTPNPLPQSLLLFTGLIQNRCVEFVSDKKAIASHGIQQRLDGDE